MSGEIFTEIHEEIQMINDNLSSTNELLLRNYSTSLFVIGCSGAIIVCLIFYKILKSFY